MEKNYYLNPKIKKTNLKETYTEHEVKEYVKCLSDPIYFIENYVKIVNLDKGLELFKLRGYQKRLIEAYYNNDKNIVLSSRQSGKTITTAAFMLWYICFNPDKTAIILANKAPTAREILARIILMLENLPFFLQPGVKTLNKGSVEFGNNSKIIATSTSSDSIRGFSCNFLYLDEFAHVKNAVEFFTSSYPTITSGKNTKIIISSTPCGLNLYYKLWMEAKSGRNDFNPVEIRWDEVPGRDEAWKRDQIAILGEDGFAQEFGNEFIGSSNTLIYSEILKELPIQVGRKTNDGYEFLEDPQENHSYVIAVDVSRGTGNDYSVCVVLDVTQYPVKIVATFRNNQIRPLILPEIILNLARKYNEAYIMVERNGNGLDVVDVLYNEYGYENIFSTKSKQRVGQVLSVGISKSYIGGIEMTKSIKRIGCSNFKSLVEEKKLINFTEDIMMELYNFVKSGDSYEADSGYTDDLVMALVMFSWAVTEDFYKELTKTDFRKELITKYVEEKEEDMPLGIIVSSPEIEQRHLYGDAEIVEWI